MPSQQHPDFLTKYLGLITKVILIEEFVGLHFVKCFVAGLLSLNFFAVYDVEVFLHY